MKKIKQIWKIALFLIMLLYAGVQTVCAKALGEDYSILGYNAGWFLIGGVIVIAFVVMFLKYTKVLKTKGAGAITSVLAIVLVIGLAMAFVEVTPADTTPTSGGCVDWKITADAVTTGTDYITNVNWDEDENIYTIMLDVEDSSAGALNCSITALNFTLDPISSSDKLATTMQTIHMSSDYNLKYSGEEVFDKTGNYFDVNWTSPTGVESYSDTQDMQLSEESWALCTWEFNNGTAGNWVTEISAIGNGITWHVNFWNDCNTWQEQITIRAIVSEYSD